MECTLEYNPGQRDASDPEIEFRMHARGIDAGQLLMGITDTKAEGPQTDADVRQAADSNVGHWPEGFSPRGDPAVTLPSAAAEASTAWCGQTTHSMPYPTTDAYYIQHPSVSRAEAAGQSSVMGSDLGCFVGQSSTRSEAERAVASARGTYTPTTTGAHTSTTSTLTSTCVTWSTVGGPVHAAYTRSPPPTGLTSVHPAHQVFMPRSIEQSGRFLGALAGPVEILRPQVGTIEGAWGDASAHSDLRPGFDMSQVASRPPDRAVDPSGPCYLSNGLVSDSVSVTRAEMYSRGSHGARPKAILESQQMCPAGIETGPTGVQPAFGASAQSSSPMGVSSHLPQPCPPSRMHVVQNPGMHVQSMCIKTQSPATQGDQVGGHKSARTPVPFLACLKSHFLPT